MEDRNGVKIFGQSVNLIIGIAVLVIFLIGFAFITSIILRIFYSWIFAIGVLAAIAVIDYKVIVTYVKWLINLVNNNSPVGIAATVGSVIGYPFVLTFLLAKAAIKKRFLGPKSTTKQPNNEYIDFEELDSKPLDIPEIRKEEKSSDYNDIFEK